MGGVGFITNTQTSFRTLLFNIVFNLLILRTITTCYK
jgi:hypothetical protein